MLKKVLLFWVFICFFGAFAQENKSAYETKKITLSKDTIAIEKVSINPNFFQVFDAKNIAIDSSFYKINFQKAQLVFNPNYTTKDSITINYLKFPDFLTKEYSIYDASRVVPNQEGNLYSLQKESKVIFKPFDGLATSGSITRGVTIGNNQNAVVNSNLDLQITGKISEKVSIRASIQDSNLPLQNSGYSQRISEFDQIFMEVFSDKWNLRGGDIFLENRQSKFLNFNKKVQGIATNFNFGKENNKTNVYASAALVRGQYAKSNFVGQEGNQGPYKLKGQNGELYIIVISGSERVFVNGILLKQGENNDYTIDYNAGEIKFTSLYPITSEMRISIEYQFTDQNYTRFITYFGVNHEQEKWSIGANIYSENDNKNQPLQQNISTNQAQILANAGDDIQLMNSVSAYEDSFSINKILYKKTVFNGNEIFEYSNVATDVLFNVKFSSVGTNQGNYILKNGNAIGKIYEYIAPIAGSKQGNYEPITRLVAPTKIEIASITGNYFPSEKTTIDFELGISNNDLNLFSSQNDNDNKGLAGKINAKQRLFSGKWNIDGLANYQFVQKDFRTIERLFTIEFNRDWNINTVSGNQSYLNSGLVFSLPKKGTVNYQFENLSFSDNFLGNRQQVTSDFKLKNWTFNSQNSYLQSDGNLSKSKFLRSQTQSKFHFKKNWFGATVRGENNQEKLKTSNGFSSLSQKFFETGTFVGRGDSTKVYTEIGVLNRVNDSLQNSILKRVNTSQSYYLKSKLIQTENRNLSIFLNYRNLKFEDKTKQNEPSLNSRIIYNDRFFDQLMVSNTVFETNSGTIAQQEFTYLQVDSGRGVYTWNDYNGNGIQEIQEFEVAPFQDQAKYVRLFLPNQIFIKTHQNKFSEALTFNFLKFQNSKGFLKILSNFYNQTNFSIDRKIKRDGNKFDLNPFQNSDTDLLGLNASFQNSLYYNRGKQNHSLTYSYLTNQVKNQFSVGAQQNKTSAHQLRYEHLLQVNWLLGLDTKIAEVTSESENFTTRNYTINSYKLAPKISYLFSKTASWDLFYEFQKKENTIGELEKLKQSKFGTSFSFTNEKKFSMNGEFSFYDNNFVGNEQTAASFQILEGLQAGKNTTWRFLVQKNLSQFLELNVNYQGRKSENSQTIHTGNVQLRAYF
jgi:hypothetical protein